MDKVNLTTHSEEETMAFGEWIGAHAVNDLFIALNGDLGTGKTHFVQGLAKGMGINDAVGSPTFMIMNYYEGVLPLKHFDFYRLGDEKWADVFPALLPPEIITVHIERINETMRHISLCWGKGAPESVVKEIIKYVACH